MITNNGKELVSKYLIGQAPAYASHIAIGCGAKPLDANDTPPSNATLQAKEVLDFEMTRVPIVSRGFVDDAGTTKIVLTAELPAETRYEITEVGLWSAGANNLAVNSDSHVIFSFQESWQKHDSIISEIPFLTSISASSSLGNINVSDTVFAVATDNQTLNDGLRLARKEGPRFLNSTILMRGDTSNITSSKTIDLVSASANGSFITFSASNSFTNGDYVTVSGTTNSLFNVFNQPVLTASANAFTVASSITGSASGGIAWAGGSLVAASAASSVPIHIHLNSVNMNIQNNSPVDELKLAFSLVDKTALGSAGDPDKVKMILQFYNNEANNTTGYAYTELIIPGSSFTNNRYHVATIPLSNVITTNNFSWASVRICRIFVCVEKSNQPSSDFYIAFDALRIDNLTAVNPLYALSGYSIIQIDGKPIVKARNTNSYIEFRLALGLA